MGSRESDLADLLSCLSYEPESGLLRWTVVLPHCQMQIGDEAGFIDVDGYSYIYFRDRKFLAHRLCWRLHFGSAPEIIDHANMDKSDNRIFNLRAATVAENNRNRGKQSNNTSGYKGVSFHKGMGKFHARIMRDKVERSLGYFKTAEEAAEAYKNAAKELHNEFARF